VRANTSRGGRLSFDRVAGIYAKARRPVPAEAVRTAAERAGLKRGARVLEVGAAVGQLTRPLLDAGFRVVALEPGDRLRAHLAKRVGDQHGAVLHGGFFEDYAGAEAPFSAVWSADAFHWVDPAVSYRRAAELLKPGGHLVLQWSFPTAADPEVQRRLNEEVLAVHCPDHIRDPDEYGENVDQLETLVAGRAEIADSGCYGEVRHWVTTERYSRDVGDYSLWLQSFGNTAELDEAGRARLTEAVAETVRGAGLERIDMVNRISTSLARRAD
jgi:SAM-dependent methyltransferase